MPAAGKIEPQLVANEVFIALNVPRRIDLFFVTRDRWWAIARGVSVSAWLACLLQQSRLLGQYRSVLVGGTLITLGHFSLAFHALPFFYTGLALIVLGTGLLKANASTLVGSLYEPGDTRRDAGFSLFYMGINTGAFLAPLVCSTLGEDPAYGWRIGFFAAGIGMLLSVLIQLAFAQRYIGDVGREPAAQRSLKMSGGEKKPLTQVERDRLRVIFVIFTFVVIFWATFEQAGGLMNLFAEKYARREVGAFLVPTGWFQSLNPLFIILLGIPFSMLWSRLGARGKNPPTPVKMYLGLAQVALGFVCLVLAVFEMQASGDAKSGMIWLVLAYFFHTTGELCISPVGLSMVTKLAPLRLGSLMMGVWFLVNFVGNTLAGYIGAFTEHMGEYPWMVELAAGMGVRAEHAGLLGVFGGLAVVLLVFSLALWMISGRVVAWMHGAEKTTK